MQLTAITPTAKGPADRFTGEPLLCLGNDFAETDLLLVGPDTDETGTDTTRTGEPSPE